MLQFRHMLLMGAILLPGPVLLAPASVMQTPPYPFFWNQQAQWEPLDAGVEDLGPLSSSLRRVGPDLRQPTGFERVYLAPLPGDQLMRVDGGLHAVFPRSQYAGIRFGSRPVIPAGTVFHIGPPLAPDLPRITESEQPGFSRGRGMSRQYDNSNSPPHGISRASNRYQRSGRRLGIREISLPARVTRSTGKEPISRLTIPYTAAGKEEKITTPSHPALVHNPEYRRRRLHHLMAQALRGIQEREEN